MSGFHGVLCAGGAFSTFTRTFNAAGSFTETIPAGATTAIIEAWGPGGNGGGVGSTLGGGGGGSGGYCRTSLSVTGSAGKTLNITIGAAGSATTVISGTQTITSMNAPSGANGVSGNSGGAGGGGSSGTGGTVANLTGNTGTAGGATQTGGAGAAGIAGVNGTGGAGGHGGNTLTSGQDGQVVIKYT
jgi:hypothetical protein